MKKFILLLLSMSFILSLIGCDNVKHTPGYRVINEKYELWAMSSEEISLIKLDEIGAETGVQL